MHTRVKPEDDRETPTEECANFRGGLTQDGLVVISFECVTFSSKPVDEMFDLARSVDAHTDSQSSSEEQAVAGVTDGLIGFNQEVTWRAQHFGVPFKLTSKVTEFEAPHRFVDEQIRGPFKTFHHEHRFEASTEGSVMIDRIRFSAPFGLIGRLVEKLVLAPYMQRLIEDRGVFLAESWRGSTDQAA